MKLLARLTDAAIAGLLFACCPPAIPWLIVSIIIWVSIEAGSLRPWPHIRQESKKVVAPFSAHRDATPAVVCISHECRLIASVFCATPRRIFRCVLQAMFEKALPANCGPVLSASVSSALNKMSSLHDRRTAAVTRAIPSSLTVLRAFRMERKHYQFAKSPAHKIDETIRRVTSAASGYAADHI